MDNDISKCEMITDENTSNLGKGLRRSGTSKQEPLLLTLQNNIRIGVIQAILGLLTLE